jgi:hypothetical protein
MVIIGERVEIAESRIIYMHIYETPLPKINGTMICTE